MSGRYEREFVNALTAEGYGAVRIPTSGSATDRDLPDVLYGEPALPGEHHAGRAVSHAVAVEHKSGRATTLYVGEDEVAALRRFADAFGAEAMLAARYTTKATPTAHYLVRPDDARQSGTGDYAYGLPVEDIEERAIKTFDP